MKRDKIPKLLNSRSKRMFQHKWIAAQRLSPRSFNMLITLTQAGIFPALPINYVDVNDSKIISIYRNCNRELR